MALENLCPATLNTRPLLRPLPEPVAAFSYPRSKSPICDGSLEGYEREGKRIAEKRIDITSTSLRAVALVMRSAQPVEAAKERAGSASQSVANTVEAAGKFARAQPG